MNKTHVLSEIKRTAEENGGIPLGRDKFEKETGIKQWDWTGKYWNRWSEALAEAGYPPNTMQKAFTDEYLLQKLVELIKELDHFPTATERRLKWNQSEGFPSHNTFSRFGNKHDLIQAVLKYCETHEVESIIIDLCTTAAAKAKPSVQKLEDIENVEFGFVYILKSGRYYKIGKNNCAERREYELGIQLPEKLKLIRKIKTDDPFGIEKYWHDRFKSKRKNGEWFDLSAADVKAFRRRTFM